MTNAGSHRREELLFTEAVSLPQADRPSFLASACGDDMELRSRIENLLRAHEAEANALDCSPAQEVFAAMADAAREPVGETLASNAGRYVFGEKLGEGGWGAVHVAEQLQPVRRSVALKIIKLGMDTRAVVARFRGEQQALALMDHPNIAKVFDAGETSTGRPFFAMELVTGEKITAFCDRQRLGLPARLRLFAQVCGAIQHAHQKGIIHRDLKPSNILVADRDGTPQPKVIDFGIAKATHGRLADATVVTEIETFMGTPVYVSPEQATNPGGDIDTRADIYSLGVVLYELLSGTTPLDATELRGCGVDEVRRRICQVEATRPSVRLRAAGSDRLGVVARDRRLDPPALVAALAGDLDWIVLRCLEKDRNRRYESVDALAGDIERYLRHEPVAACPPSRAYLLRKLVRRHRFAFAAGGAVAFALMAGVAVSTTLMLKERATRIRALVAEEAQANARRRAEDEQRKALTAAERSDHVSRLLLDMLMGIETSRMPGRDTALLLEILERSENRVGTQLRHQPEVQADLRQLIGWMYFRLGNPARAEVAQRAALAQRRELYGTEHPKVAEILTELGYTLAGNPAEAVRADREGLLREAVAILRRDPAGETLLLARALAGLSHTLQSRNELVEAEAVQREALAITRRLDSGAGALAPRLLGLGWILMHAKEFDAAESAVEEVLQLFPRHRLENDPESYRTQAQELLTDVLLAKGQPARAELLIREALDRRRQLQKDSPQVGSDLDSLRRALQAQHKFVEAESVAREAVALWRGWSQREPSNVLYTRRCAYACNWLGSVLQALGKSSEASAARDEAKTLLARLPEVERKN